MKRTLVLAIAVLAASSAAVAQDVDFQPHGFVSAVMREAKADHRAAAHVEKPRAQARAEALEAARLGLLNNSEAAKELPTRQQARQIEQAGQRAVAVQAASK
jgi:hypothetical protein